MFILAFSLDWFTTIPGILISLGVVLLIIAFILFIAGGKKAKVENKEVEEENISEEVSVDNTVQPVVDTVDVSNVQPQDIKFDDINVGTPGVDPINPTTTEAPVNVEEVKEEVKEEENVASQPNEFVFDTNATVVTEHSAPYGGNNPIDTITIPTEHKEEVKPTIYGGNDPLEATQNLPKVDEHHEIYGGAINEVKIVEPVSEPVIEVPEVQPIEIETPVQEPISIEVPTESVEQPVSNESSMEIPAAPVEIPSAPVESPVEEVKPSVEEL